MPKFLENKLKRRYGSNSKVPYKIMNSIGAMRGNQETAKGREMDRKHRADERSKRRTTKASTRRMHRARTPRRSGRY